MDFQKRLTLKRTLGTAVAMAALPSLAQTFPTKPIRWIVGYPPGSGLDFVARVVAEGMSKDLGQPVVVDNKAGAAGAIAAAALAAAPSDGYSLLSVDMGAYSLNPHLYTKLAYDPRRDFAMTGMMVTLPMVMFVPVSLGVSTVAEFVAYVKSKPEKSVNFASSGMGNPVHLTMEMFQRKAGLNMVHVPYKGSPPAVADLAAGLVSAMFVDPSTAMPFVQSGKLRVIGTNTLARLPTLPDVPTLKESGYDVFFPVWLAMAMSASTPKPLVERINHSLNETMKTPQVSKRLSDAGFIVGERMSAQQTEQFARSEYQNWGKTLAPMNIKLE